MQSCNLVSISCGTDRHESVWRVLVGCGLLNWIYPDHCTPVMLHFFDLSKLSKKFCFPEELAVVPWGKVRDGARALCRCNLQFDLGCMHSFPCASLALSGRQWSVSTLVFYGGRSWCFPFPLQQHLSGIRSLSFDWAWDPTQAYMLMTYAAFLFSHLYFASSDLFVGGNEDAGKSFFFPGNHVTPKIIYDSAESLCKRYLCLILAAFGHWDAQSMASSPGWSISTIIGRPCDGLESSTSAVMKPLGMEVLQPGDQWVVLLYCAVCSKNIYS